MHFRKSDVQFTSIFLSETELSDRAKFKKLKYCEKITTETIATILHVTFVQSSKCFKMLQKSCFEMFIKVQEVNMKIIEPLRNS